jgi:thioredoxin reductase/ferredoxin
VDILSLVIYALPLGVIVAVYVWRQRRIHARHLRAMQDSVAAGMIEPASLHPLIDESKCLGCGSCITACPETSHHDVLGLINGKAALIGPSECIGHGACKTACPFDAITLVFGTERRGLDIPVLKPNFESNVPGIYIAGELGGIGLIKNALTQGRQAMEAIAKAGVKRRGALDVLIVGAGPAGLAASLAAKQLGLNYLTVEQEALGGAVFQYPRGKLVMTAPVELPIVGKVHFRNTTKEELLQFWSQACNGLKISYRERVEGLQRQDGGILVKTTKGHHVACAVLLGIGRRGTPRKLDVPGEALAKVVYRLIDPEQYRGQNVVVVGGGDSALEAAASIAELGDARVVLSYRGEAFQRAKQRNRERVDTASAGGLLNVMLNSVVKEILPDAVTLKQSDQVLKVPNDAIIVSAGGILPNEFLKSIGIEVDTKYGTA